MLDLSSNEVTVGISHSFCSDFQGMHLWESSSIQAHAQMVDMQSCRFHHGSASELNHISVRSGQSRAMGQEMQPVLRASKLVFPEKRPEVEGVAPVHTFPSPNL